MVRQIMMLIAFLMAVHCSFGQSDTILSRYKQYLFAGTRMPENAGRLAGSLNSAGQWGDINYEDASPGKWKPLIHITRVRDLAYAWANPQSPYYHQKGMLQSAERALGHWLEKRYTCPNWWHNEIGVPRRDCIVLREAVQCGISLCAPFGPWLILRKNLHDLLNRIPTASSCGHTEELLDFSEIADRLHLSAIDTQNESILDRDDLEQPVVGRGETVREIQRKRKRERFS